MEEKIKWSEIEPLCVLRFVLYNGWMVVLALLTGMMGAVVVTDNFIRPQYQCSMTFAAASKAANATYYANSSAAEQIAATFTALFKSNIMTDKIVDTLGTLPASVTAEQIGSTQLIKVSATADSPEKAFQTIKAIEANYNEMSDYVSQTTVLNVLNIPRASAVRSNPVNTRKISLVSGFVCAAAMTAALVWLSVCRDTVHNFEGARSKIDGKILTSIPHERRRIKKGEKNSLLITSPTVSFGFTEAFNQVTALFETEKNKGAKIFIFTSVSESEGKSTIAANAALSLSQKQENVLLVDLDLRKPVQSEIFGVVPPVDFGELLGRKNLTADMVFDSACCKINDCLCALLSAREYPEMVERLGSMGEILQSAEQKFDYIIIDTPPAGYFSDTEILTGIADAAVLVVRQDVASAEQINDTIDELTGCRFMGVILNDMRHLLAGNSVYGYGYYGRYGYGTAKYGYSKYGYGKYDSEKSKKADKGVRE